MKRILLSTLFLLPLWMAAQFSLTEAFPAVRDADGRALPLAWLGGLNAPQYMSVDLDGDGRRDLFIFDRAGDAQIALRRTENGALVPDAGLRSGFPPDLTDWVLLRDYDKDGVEDLFAYSAEFDGFRVHRGLRSASGLLSFASEPTYAGLQYPYNGGRLPIFVTPVDYPAIDDLDGDGDLDILTFSVPGYYVEYYRNYSVERGFGTDTLIYELETDCWGGFFESGIDPALNLAPSPGQCYGKSLPGDTAVERRHAGSTLLTLDVDGNGLKDIMLGDISSEYLVLGYNKGSTEEAWISDQDPYWPSDGVEVDIPLFPAAYHLDVDEDGDRDILAAPSQTLNAEDVNVGWYYENTGSDAVPAFVFRDSQYLVRDAIDLGSGGLPGTFDYDADGRPDLVVGNDDNYGPSGILDSRLRVFRNVGAPGEEAVFELVEEDYLELSQFEASSSAFAPAFGDLDGDGDEDAIVGERSGRLIYYQNLAGPGQPPRFAAPVFGYMDIDVGLLAKPDIADLDRDGLGDLVVGGYDGRIRFYRNVGTPGDARFNADEGAAGNALQLGGINTNKPGIGSGHPTPRVLTYENRFLLLTGNRSGTLEAYSFTDYRQPFTALGDTVAGLDVGGYSAPAVADFDGDGLADIVIGNERGGVSYYRTDLAAEMPTGLFDPPGPELYFSLFPNPSGGTVTLAGIPEYQGSGTLRVFDARGVEVYTRSLAGQTVLSMDLGGLPGGLYIVEIRTATGRGVQRLRLQPVAGTR